MPIGLPANAIRHLSCVDLHVRKVQRLRAKLPRGVRTSAKSEGDLFKETKISRQAQMQAAHEAPEE
jgi:hypothetical protein